MFLLRCKSSHEVDCRDVDQTVQSNPDVAGIGVRPQLNTSSFNIDSLWWFLGSNILSSQHQFGSHLRLYCDNTRMLLQAFRTKASSQFLDGKNLTATLVLVECLQEDSPRIQWYTIAHRNRDAGDSFVSPLHHHNILLLDRYQLGLSFNHYSPTDNGGFEGLFQ